MRFPVNMAAPLGACPVCRDLVYKTEGAWLDVLIGAAWYADTEFPHRHQPERAGKENTR